VPVPTELLAVSPGGLTADRVGERAGATSWNARAAEENLRGAAARVDEAWSAFLPRLTGVAKYTRLSGFTPPTIGLFPPGFCAGASGAQAQICSALGPAANGFAFPLVLNQWLLQAGIVVPISDYFFRIDQSYTSATRSQDAARWDIVTQRTASVANGKAAYYTWLRARGAVIVAVQALNDQRTHLRDARNQFAVGNASKADVLRAETAVSSAELAVERAKNLADLSEKQLRVAMHASDDEALSLGESLEGPLPPVEGNLKQMTAEALTSRPEIKSADANADAARQQADAAKAGRYPNLSAFADGILGNPNPRVFPPSQDWFGTWDLGAQLTWSPNDIPLAGGSVRDYESRAAAIEANKGNVRDGIEVEVTQALQAVREADFAIESSTREQASAEEAYRVARELFNNGRGTSTTLTDAETDLTRSRLDLLNAKADARVARVRLDHALGRDVAASAR
jgi:outer membrane protein TolC